MFQRRKKTFTTRLRRKMVLRNRKNSILFKFRFDFLFPRAFGDSMLKLAEFDAANTA